MSSWEKRRNASAWNATSGEITFAAKMLTQRGFSALLTYGTALVLYFCVSWALASLGRWAERRLTHRPAAVTLLTPS